MNIYSEILFSKEYWAHPFTIKHKDKGKIARLTKGKIDRLTKEIIKGSVESKEIRIPLQQLMKELELVSEKGPDSENLTEESLLENSLLRQEFKKFSEELTQNLDKKTAFNILSDYWGKGRNELEGHQMHLVHHFLYSLSTEIQSLDLDDSKVFAKLSPEYQKTAEFTSELAKLSKEGMLPFIQEYLLPKIKSLQVEGENTIFLPLGWSGLQTNPQYPEHSGHALLIQIQKYKEGDSEKFRLRILNTGAGLQYHESAQKGKKLKYRPDIEWSDISQEQLVSESFWRELIEAEKIPEWYADERPFYSEENVYKPVYLHFGEPSRRYRGSESHISGQRAGTCAKKSADLVARMVLSPTEYKQYQIDLSLITLVILYQRFVDEQDTLYHDVEVLEILKKGIEKLEWSIIKSLQTEGLITTDKGILKRVIATVIDLSQKINGVEKALSEENFSLRTKGEPLTSLEDAALEDIGRASRKAAIEELRLEVNEEPRTITHFEQVYSKGQAVKKIEFPKTRDEVDSFLDQLRAFVKHFRIGFKKNRPPHELVVELHKKLFDQLPIPTEEDNPWGLFTQSQALDCLEELSALTHHSLGLSVEGCKYFASDWAINYWKIYRIGIELAQNIDDTLKNEVFTYRHLDQWKKKKGVSALSGDKENELLTLLNSFQSIGVGDVSINGEKKYPFFDYSFRRPDRKWTEVNKLAELQWWYRHLDGQQDIREVLNLSRYSMHSASEPLARTIMSNENRFKGNPCAHYYYLRDLAHCAYYGTFENHPILVESKPSLFNLGYNCYYFNGQLTRYNFKNNKVAKLTNYFPFSLQELWAEAEQLRKSKQTHRLVPYLTNWNTEQKDKQALVIHKNIKEKREGFSKQSHYEFGVISNTDSPVSLSILLDKFERNPSLLLTSGGREYFTQHILDRTNLLAQIKSEPILLKRIIKYLSRYLEEFTAHQLTGKYENSLARVLLSYRLINKIQGILQDIPQGDFNEESNTFDDLNIEIYKKMRVFLFENLPTLIAKEKVQLIRLVAAHLVAYCPKFKITSSENIEVLEILGKFPLTECKEDSSLLVDLSRKMHNFETKIKRLLPSEVNSLLRGYVERSDVVLKEEEPREIDEISIEKTEVMNELEMRLHSLEKELQKGNAGLKWIHHCFVRISIKFREDPQKYDKDYAHKSLLKFAENLYFLFDREKDWSDYWSTGDEANAYWKEVLRSTKKVCERYRIENHEKWCIIEQKVKAWGYSDDEQREVCCSLLIQKEKLEEQKKIVSKQLQDLLDLSKSKAIAGFKEKMIPGVWYVNFPIYSIKSEGGTILQVDLLRGTTFVNGKEQTQFCLPQNIRGRSDLQLTFRSLLKMPVRRKGVEYKLMEEKFKALCFVDDFFGTVKLEDEKLGELILLPIEQRREIIDHFPLKLRSELFTYWLDSQHRIVICRHDEKGFPDPRFLVDRDGYISLADGADGHVLIDCPDPNNLNFKMLSLIKGICPPDKCLVWKNRENNDLKEVIVPLANEKKIWLSFKKLPGKEGLRWNENPQFKVAHPSKQKLSQLTHYPYFLSLEDDDQEKKKIIIVPSKLSSLRYKQNDISAVDTPTQDSPKYITLDVSPEGELTSNSIKGRLYLAYVKLMESDYSGAMAYLKKAAPVGRPYSPTELEILQWIVDSNNELADRHPGASSVRLMAGAMVYEKIRRFKQKENVIKKYREFVGRDRSTLMFWFGMNFWDEKWWKPSEVPSILGKDYKNYFSHSNLSKKWRLDTWLTIDRQLDLAYAIDDKSRAFYFLTGHDELLFKRGVPLLEDKQGDIQPRIVGDLSEYSRMEEGQREEIIELQKKRIVENQTWSGENFKILFWHLYQKVKSGDRDEILEARNVIKDISSTRFFETESSGFEKCNRNQIYYAILEKLSQNQEGFPEYPSSNDEEDKISFTRDLLSKVVVPRHELKPLEGINSQRLFALLGSDFNRNYEWVEKRVNSLLHSSRVDSIDLNKLPEEIENLLKSTEVCEGDSEEQSKLKEEARKRVLKLKRTFEDIIKYKEIEKGVRPLPEQFKRPKNDPRVLNGQRLALKIEEVSLWEEMKDVVGEVFSKKENKEKSEDNFRLLALSDRNKLSSQDKESMEEIENDIEAYLSQDRKIYKCESPEKLVMLKDEISTKADNLLALASNLEEKILTNANRLPDGISELEKMRIKMGRLKGSERVFTMPRLIGMMLRSRKEDWEEMTGLSEAERLQLRKQIITYLLIKTEEQHCRRVVMQVEKIDSINDIERNLAIQELGQTLDTKRSYDDPVKAVQWLIFEYYAEIRLYPKQKNLLDKLAFNHLDPKMRNRVVQLIMGGGKSKVLTPILAFCAADGCHLSTVTVPSQMYGTAKRDLSDQFRKMFDASLEVFEFSRDKCDISNLELIDKYLERAIREGIIVVTRPNDLLSMKLMLSERLETISQIKKLPGVKDEEIVTCHRELDLICKILKRFQQKQVNLIDEYDSVNNPLNLLNFPIGEARVIDTVTIREATILYFNWLKEIEHELHITTNQQSKYIKKQRIKDFVIKKVMERFKEKASDLGISSPEIEQYLRNAKTKGGKATKESIACYRKMLKIRKLVIEEKDFVSSIAFYRQSLKQDLFTALDSEANVTFGLSIRDHDFFLAMPWEKGEPKEGSRFSHYLETLFKTYQYYLQPSNWTSTDPIRQKKITALVGKMISYYIEKEENRQVDKGKVKILKELFGVRSLQKIDTSKEDLLEGYCKKISEALKVCEGTEEQRESLLQLIADFFETHLIPKQLEVEPIKITASPQDLMTLGLSNKGFSGTFADRASWDPGTEVLPSPGTDGHTAYALIQNSTCLASKAQSVDERMTEYVDMIKENPNISALIDLGAELQDLSTHTIAQSLLQKMHGEDLIKKAVLCYVKNPDNEWVLAIYSLGRLPKILEGSDYATVESAIKSLDLTKEQVITYYDYSHIIGADIKQPVPSMAIVTLSNKSQLELQLQAVMRMRKLGHFVQNAAFVMSDDVKTYITRTLGMNPESVPSVKNIIAFGKIIGKARERKRNFHSIIKQMRQVIKKEIDELIISTENHEKREKIYSLARSYYVTEQEIDPFLSFGLPDEEKYPFKIINEEKGRLLEDIRRIVNAAKSKVKINAVKELLNKIIEKHKKNKTQLPEKVSTENNELTANATHEIQIQTKVKKKQQVLEEEIEDFGLEGLSITPEVPWPEDLDDPALFNGKEEGPEFVKIEDIPSLKALILDDNPFYHQNVLFSENIIKSFETKGYTFGTKIGKPLHHVLVVQDNGSEPKLVMLSLEEGGMIANRLASHPELNNRQMWLIDPHGQVIQNGKVPWKNPFDNPTPENQKLRFAMVQALVLKGDVYRLRQPKFREHLSNWIKTLTSNQRNAFRKVMDLILLLHQDDLSLLAKSPRLTSVINGSMGSLKT